MSKARTAIVTGGAQGIGFGIVRALLAKGHRVAIFDVSDEALGDAISQLGKDATVLPIQCDVTSGDAVQRAVTKVSLEWDAPQILVNNAGISRDMRIGKMTEADWDLTLDVNLKSMFLCAQAVLPGMVDTGFGRVVNMSSRAWLGGFGQSAYSASKGGVVSLTRSLALEFAAKGVTVNAVAPGIVQTPLFEAFDEDLKERLKKSVPARRIGTPEDIANAVCAFTSEDFAYVTGQLLYVCGGRSLAGPSV